MSALTLSRFVAHLALDYNKLARYLEAPDRFLPAGQDAEATRAKIIRACGDLADDEIEWIRTKNWDQMFARIADGRPRTDGTALPQEQGSYPDP